MPSRPSAAPPAPALLDGEKAPGLDRRTAERLRRGRLPIDDRVDLHGLTQAQAHAAVADRVLAGFDAGRRVLLVITGKGGFGGAGVLRAGVPRWLNEAPLRERVLSFSIAQPKDGGAGAFYILLKRRRDR